MMKKALMQGMAFLLVVLPFLGSYAGTVDAATSRVAIIKSLTGTVQVKKSGGSKQFKAFARMSLNEGDVLTTSANSTAVLQFANGTSEDDKMSVAANTTLTFSKLSDRSGTRTKVSMFNGSAWVDVKSIASKNDEFTLETPTAVMGVRGTHLLVSVDPDTGATKLTVVAGVVNTQPTGNGEPQDVKPGDNALVTKDEQDNGDVTVAPADLELLMKQSDKSIVEAIVAASGEIVKENQQKLDQYFDSSSAASADELNRKKTNVENLLGAIVDNAVKSGLITKERVDQLVAEAQAQTGVKIDLSKKDLTLSDEEKRKQDEQKKKDEEAKRQAEEQRKKEEEQRDKELQKKLEEERKKKEEENQKALEEKKKKAEEEYEKQLSDAEKQRYQQDKQQREEESGAGVTQNTGNNSQQIPPPSPPFYGLIYQDAEGHTIEKSFESLLSNPDLGTVSANNFFLQVTRDFAQGKSIISVDVKDEMNDEMFHLEDGSYWIPLYKYNYPITVNIVAEGINEPVGIHIDRNVNPNGINKWDVEFPDGGSSPKPFEPLRANEYLIQQSLNNSEIYIEADKSVESIAFSVISPSTSPAVTLSVYKESEEIENKNIFTVQISNLPNDDVTKAMMTLKNSNGGTIGVPQTLYFVNGEPSILETITKPFIVVDKNNTPVTYNLNATNYNFRVPSNMNEILIGRAPDAPDWLVPGYGLVFDSSIYADHKGYLHVPLQLGITEYDVYYRGLDYENELYIYRADVPNGLEETWHAVSLTGSESSEFHYWTPVQDVPDRYYIEVSSDAGSVELYFPTKPGATAYLKDNVGNPVEIVDGIATLTNLTSGNQYYYLTVNGIQTVLEIRIDALLKLGQLYLG